MGPKQIINWIGQLGSEQMGPGKMSTGQMGSGQMYGFRTIGS